MRKGTPAAVSVGLALLFLAGMAAAVPSSKRLTLTTKSPAAREAFTKGIVALESFEFQKGQEFARQAVAADSAFAFGYMLVAAFLSPQQRQPYVDKYLALAGQASPGEQKYLEGMKHFHANQTEQAIAVFARLHQELPDDRMVCMMLGMLYQAAGRPAEAIPCFEAAIKLEGSTPRAYSMLGGCHLLQGNYARAREYFATAISKLRPDSAPAGPYFGVTFSHLYEGKPDLALANEKQFLDRYIKTGAAQNFPPVWIYNNMARIYLENGHPEEALRLYEQGYESVPGSSIDSTQKQLWYGRKLHGAARALAKMGRHEEAWQIAEQVKKMIAEGGKEAEQYWEAYNYLAGYLKLEAGDYAAAAEYLGKADQDDPFQKLLLARAQLKLGKKAEALTACRDILKTNTSNMERALAYAEAQKTVAALTAN